MLDLMPKKFIKRSDINKWEMYSDGLVGQKYAQKYTEKLLKKWVATLNNPLNNPWVKHLFENRLRHLDVLFERIESDIGEENLMLFIDEISNDGIKEIILVVEIEGDIEMDPQVARAKEQAGQEYFDALTERLMRENPINVEEEFRTSLHQHYKFFLLHPNDNQHWFRDLKTGNIVNIQR